MLKSEELSLHPLLAISPIDGRHRTITEPLSAWLSEYALMKYRLYLEVEYLIALSECQEFRALRDFTLEEKEFLRDLVNNFSLQDAQTIQNIDRFGYKGQRPINHDVKAVEYFLKEKLQSSSLAQFTEIVHFGLTSEDANNVAYNAMLRGALKLHYVPSLVKLVDKLAELAKEEKNTALLSKTHGQAATPSTFGKEFANYIERLRKELTYLQKMPLPTKANGAIGAHNAQVFAAPEVDWLAFTEDFIENLGFEANLFTTQIENHDGIARIFSSLVSINNILKDMCVDFWMYISAGYFTQANIAHEVGSSTMPHKINPWRLEVGEGSTAEANAKLQGFINKLQSSRLQRDLSDHEAQRAIGVGVAHSYLATVHIAEELDRLKVNREIVSKDLKGHGNILTEAIQTLLRIEGNERPYELMKEFSRGEDATLTELREFIRGMDIREETRMKLLALKPEEYIGLAPKLTDIALQRWEEFKLNYEEPYTDIRRIIIDRRSLKLSENEKVSLQQISERGIELVGINVSPEEISYFNKVINDTEFEEECKGDGTVFVGERSNFFDEANKRLQVCIKLGIGGEFSMHNLVELPYLINALQ